MYCYSCLGSVEEIEESLVGSTLHLLELNTVLVDLEGRHALDSSGGGALSVGINIEFLHGELGVGSDVTLIDGSNTLARRAPGGSEVDNEGLATVGSSCDSGIEFSLGSEVH